MKDSCLKVKIMTVRHIQSDYMLEVAFNSINERTRRIEGVAVRNAEMNPHIGANWSVRGRQ